MIPVSNSKNAKTQNAELTILKAIAYFDIFDYPLFEKEIKNFLSCPLNEEQFHFAKQKLVDDKVIFKFNETYCLDDSPTKTEKRLEGNRRANKLIPTAIKIGGFLHKFPYVRGVLISGSLSKGYADEKADVDFFIITKANRLWIARTILHLFKKLTFLFRTQDLYCMNYFIDENALEIPEKNIYTATEIVTLLPVAGSKTSSQFFETNSWVNEWLPACTSPNIVNLSDKRPFYKILFEWVFNNTPGDWLDDLLFKWTTRRWQKKEQKGHKNAKGKVMNLLTSKHFSKSDPEAFQEKIVELYEAKVRQLRNRCVND